MNAALLPPHELPLANVHDVKERAGLEGRPRNSGISVRNPQAETTGAIGGSLKMLYWLGIGGRKVRKGPNCILAQS
jgi:hypothetical protein